MNYVDFGRYLAQQRELRGLSRQEVVKATKIPDSVITALEEGQRDRLPARVFVLNYVRAYATTIGLATEDALLRFEELDAAGAATALPTGQAGQRRWALWVGLAVGLAAIAALLVWLLGHGPPAP